MGPEYRDNPSENWDPEHQGAYSPPPEEFTIKDSGKRQEYDSGMVRDTQEGKVQYQRIFDGPLSERYAAHLTKGAQKYPDDANGMPNWMLAKGTAEMLRFQESAVRHFIQWLRGDRDEDHFAAVIFNMNAYEYVLERLERTGVVANAVDVMWENQGTDKDPIMDLVPAPEKRLPLRDLLPPQFTREDLE